MGNAKIYSSSLSLSQAGTSWFVYADAVHSVSLCSVKTFRAFIVSLNTTRWVDVSTMTLLNAYTLDVLSKWYIMSSLQDAHVSFKLYPSRELAENALRLKSDMLALSVPLSSAKPFVAHCSDTEESSCSIGVLTNR